MTPALPRRTERTMKATDREKKEALEYYVENAFGYDSVEEYVEMDYAHCMSAAERKKIVSYIKKHI